MSGDGGRGVEQACGDGGRGDRVGWGRRKRLQFVDFRLMWHGRINRGDLMRQFAISVPQASGDLALYQRLAPGNLDYDRRAKTYLASAGFAPLFEQPPETYLNQLLAVERGILDPSDAWVPEEALRPDRFATLPQAARRVEPAVLRAVLRAIRDELDLEIVYQSMSRIAPARRWVGPRALASDGRRWHVRAWDHARGAFGDFVLARIHALAAERPAAPRPACDPEWDEILRVVLMPNPRLPEEQRRAIARDFGMTDGRLVLPVRRALLYYFRQQYRLERNWAELPPEQYQVVVENVGEVWEADGQEPELPFLSALADR